MRKSRTTLVFESRSDFRWNNIRFEFSDCCLQSRLNWRRYWKFLLGAAVIGLSVAIHNLTTYPRNLFVMVPSLVVTFLSKTLSQVDFLTESLHPQISYENHHVCSTKPHLWRNLVGSSPWNLSCWALIWNLVDLSPRASLSKVVAGITLFCQPWARLNVSIATLMVNMIVMLLLIIFNGLS
jgi:hypothetical protein